jgi:dipeptidyl aminopeptidase/acylaminoacyl peptidase
VAVTEPAYDPKDQSSDLWLVSTGGLTAPRKLTHTKGGEADAAWSPDGKRIAFVSKREGDDDSQVYLLDLHGGEARRLTKIAGGAAEPKFSPDGTRILFQGRFDPDAEDRRKRKYNAMVFNGFPVRHWDKWLDSKSPRLYVQSLDPAAAPVDLIGKSKLVSEPGFDGAPGSSESSLRAIWTPDGSSVVFHATVKRHESAYAFVPVHLYQAPAAGGEPAALTSGSDSFDAAYFPPGGSHLYALRKAATGKVYNLNRIVRFAWPMERNTRLEVVSATLDRPVTTFAAAPDNKTLYALAEEHGHEKLFSVPAGGGQARLLIDARHGGYMGLQVSRAAADPAAIALFDSAAQPPEVVRLDPAAGTHRAITHFNDDRLAGAGMLPMREFWFTAENGRKIHSLIALPQNFDESKKYPLVVFIHGGPHAMSRDQFHFRWNYQILTAPGYVVLAPNYTGSTGYGEEFARAIQGDPLKGPGEEIDQAVNEALKRYSFIDGTRMAAGGASYGGHLANWLQASTTRYKCLFSHAGLINLESQWGTSDGIYHREVNNGGPVWEQGPIWREQNPIRFAAKFRTPMLLTVGEKDYRVPLNQTLENWSVLQRLRIPSRLIVFPDENHWILKAENNRFFFEQLHAWLEKYLR